MRLFYIEDIGAKNGIKRMKNLIYILFFSFGSLFAQDQGTGLFEQATKAYSEGDYTGAIEKYGQILDNGRTSVAVYYNLGNAHYKLDHVASSIYYYEKALQLQGNDEDVKNNLAFAKKRTIDVIEPEQKTGVSKWIHHLISSLEADAWAWTAVVFFVFFTSLFLGYYFAVLPRRKRMFFIPAMSCLVIGIAAVVFANIRYTNQQNNRFAIVFAEKAKVQAEPNLRSAEVFLLHEGTKVNVKGNFGDWLEIKLADGKQGWIKKEKVRKL